MRIVPLCLLVLFVPLMAVSSYPREKVVSGRAVKAGIMDASLLGIKPNFPLYFVTLKTNDQLTTIYSKKALSMSLYGKVLRLKAIRRGKGKQARWWLQKVLNGVEQNQENGACRVP